MAKPIQHCKEISLQLKQINLFKKKRIARRDKKAFLSDQCKEIDENNRMGMTRDPFKKIRDTKGTFHAKMGSIKDRNGMDLTEAEDIKDEVAGILEWVAISLRIAVKRREAKSKGEKERYKHLNAEFQRIARRWGTHIYLWWIHFDIRQN